LAFSINSIGGSRLIRLHQPIEFIEFAIKDRIITKREDVTKMSPGNVVRLYKWKDRELIKKNSHIAFMKKKICFFTLSFELEVLRKVAGFREF
jgi:hypothetical protein